MRIVRTKHDVAFDLVEEATRSGIGGHIGFELVVKVVHLPLFGMQAVHYLRMTEAVIIN